MLRTDDIEGAKPYYKRSENKHSRMNGQSQISSFSDINNSGNISMNRLPKVSTIEDKGFESHNEGIPKSK